MQLAFHKYQGTGNDFILLDNRGKELHQTLTKEKIALLCDRRFGIGADGLILLTDPKASDFRMIYYNSDGGESTMCGNGGRCIVAFAHSLKVFEGDSCTFEAVDGLHEAWITEDGWVELEMIRPQGYRSVGVQSAWLDTGSPHYVRFEPKPVKEVDVYTEGHTVRYSTPYEEIGGTNANFVYVRGKNELEARTYERGVEGETLSCGTGVTAAAYAYLRQEIEAPADNIPEQLVSISTPGGDLKVKVSHFRGKKESVRLMGPAVKVFEGSISLG